MALELKCFLEINNIRVSQCCMNLLFSVTVVKSSCTFVMKQSTPVIKLGMAYMNIHVSRHLKEEPAWAIDRWLQIISNNVV